MLPYILKGCIKVFPHLQEDMLYVPQRIPENGKYPISYLYRLKEILRLFWSVCMLVSKVGDLS